MIEDKLTEGIKDVMNDNHLWSEINSTIEYFINLYLHNKE